MPAATLQARLSFHDGPFTAGLSRASKLATNFAKGVGNRMKSFITSPLGQIGAAVSGFLTYKSFESGIQGSISFGDELWKLSRRTGMSVGELATLKKVASESGGEFETLAPAIGKMQRAVFDAAKGGGAASGAFAMLHLKASNLLKLDPAEAFQIIAEKISAIENPAARAAMAIAFFGKKGTELLPMMEDIGAVDFGHLSEKAELLEKNANLFHQITITFRRLTNSFGNIFLGIADKIGPTLLATLQQLGGTNMIAVGARIGESLVTGINFARGVFADFGGFVGRVWGAIAASGHRMFSGIRRALFSAVAGGEKFTPIFYILSEGLKGAFAAALEFFDSAFRKLIGGAGEMFAGLLSKIGGSELGQMMGLDAEMGAGLAKSSAAFAKQRTDHGSAQHFANAGAWSDWMLKELKSSVSGGTLAADLKKIFADTVKKGKGPDAITVTKTDNGAWQANSFPLSQRGPLLRSGGVQGGSFFDGGTHPYGASPLLPLAERRAFENSLVANGQSRSASSPNAYGAVRFGDARRRKEAAKEALRKKQGEELTNALLENIYNEIRN